MARPKRDIPGGVRELIEAYGTLRAAARETGIPYSTLQGRLANEDRRPVAGPDELEYPELPGSELPAEQLIDQACVRFSRHLAAREARRWFEIKVKSNDPIGVAFVGDPHLDSPGCNWPLLRSHIKIMEETPGLYGVGIGDLTDNWVGRLVRLYADAEVSKRQAWKLASYLLRDTDIRWLCHLLGNHDEWGDGAALIKANAQAIVPICEWQARFQLSFPNGSTAKIHAAHNFPGQSQWNNLHGAQKMALWGDPADIFVCGHLHSWAMAQGEQPHTGATYWLARARGYKHLDDFADRLGFGSQRHGATITAVIDPGADGPKRVTCFADLNDAADYLTWKRSRA